MLLPSGRMPHFTGPYGLVFAVPKPCDEGLMIIIAEGFQTRFANPF